MIKEQFKECIALMKRDVAEFEKKFCIALIAQSVDAGAAVRAISTSIRLAVLIGRLGPKEHEVNYY